MIKRSIGIDIGPAHFCAVQLCRTDERFAVEKVYTAKTRRSTDSPRSILRTLMAEGDFDSWAEIAVSIPNENVLFRNVDSSPTSAGQASPASLCDLPVGADEVMTQMYPREHLVGGNGRHILVAVDRAALHHRLDLLAEADLHPGLADADIFAVNAAVKVNHPDIVLGESIIAHLDEAQLTLAIARDGKILAIRKLPISPSPDDVVQPAPEPLGELIAHETQITWRKLFGREVDHDTKLYLASPQDIADNIASTIQKHLPCRITIVDPYTTIQAPAERNGHAAICVAEGLALRLLAPEIASGLNFVDACRAQAQSNLNVKSELRTLGLLAALVAIVAIAGFFIRLWRLEYRYNKVQAQITEIFRRTLPEEKNIVNPLAQLEQKITAMRAGYSPLGWSAGQAAGPLDILNAVTTAIPDNSGITVNNILITPDSVRLSGTSSEFAAVYGWQQQLQQHALFSVVNVQDIHRQSAGQPVNFTILISLAGTK